jgi:hypothetical protein
LEASFDGILVKELLSDEAATSSKDLLLFPSAENLDETKGQRKKVNVCYYTLKLAEYGELF